jgi:hypothetical protein
MLHGTRLGSGSQKIFQENPEHGKPWPCMDDSMRNGGDLSWIGQNIIFYAAALITLLLLLRYFYRTWK